MCRRGTALTRIAVAVSLTFFSGLGLAASQSFAKDAIGGTGINAIGGTGRDAIGGTGRTVKRSYSGDAIGGTGTGRMADVLVRGPVQKVDRTANSLTVFERQFRLSADAHTAASISDAISGGETVVLTVVGRLGRNGEIQSGNASIAREQYAAGSSQVVLSGRVKAVDTSVGRLIIGQQVVDFTSVLADTHGSVKVGDVVRIVGTQAQLNGTITAQMVLAAD